MTPLADQRTGDPALQSFPGLSHLIHPIGLDVFQTEHWEKKPLVVHRNDPGYYADVMSLDDVDCVLSLSSSSLGNVRVVMDGKETPVSDLRLSGGNGSANALEAMFERYRTGSTIVLNALNGRWEPLALLSQSLGAELSARIQANVYITPAGARGFAPHYDTHDVFIMQVHGTKHWRLATQPYALPIQGQSYDKTQPEPPPDQEFDLQCGDLLYLPRGTVHSATSDSVVSVHVTLGIHPVLYSQAITDALHALIVDDVRFRAGLPIGFTTDETAQRRAIDTVTGLLKVVQECLSAEAIVSDSVKHAVSIGLPTLRHHLTDLEEIDRIDAATKVRRRPGVRYSISVAGDLVHLDFHNKTLQLPAYVADEVRYVAGSNGAGFTGSAIPGDLDEPGRLVLIRTLLHEGFLTLD